jgi:hypothetical protein
LQRDASEAAGSRKGCHRVGCHVSGQAVARPSEVGERRQTMATADSNALVTDLTGGVEPGGNRQDHNYDF